MPESERPRNTTIALVLMAATGAALVVVGGYLFVSGGNLFGGLLLLFLAIPYATGSRALHAGESWGWGAGFLTGVFVVGFGLLLLPISAVAIVPAVAAMILLYRVREHYGMVRSNPEEEERKREEFRAERMANPRGLACPHCGATTLWIAPDGSAYCDTCQAGTISVPPAG